VYNVLPLLFLGGEGYRLIIRDNNRMSRLVSWPRKKLTKQ